MAEPTGDLPRLSAHGWDVRIEYIEQIRYSEPLPFRWGRGRGVRVPARTRTPVHFLLQWCTYYGMTPVDDLVEIYFAWCDANGLLCEDAPKGSLLYANSTGDLDQCEREDGIWCLPCNPPTRLVPPSVSDIMQMHRVEAAWRANDFRLPPGYTRVPYHFLTAEHAERAQRNAVVT